MLAYDRAAHLPGRPTSRLEADEVEVEPIVELAPMLAAVNAARCDAAESATTTPPDAPGPQPRTSCAAVAPRGAVSAQHAAPQVGVARAHTRVDAHLRTSARASGRQC